MKISAVIITYNEERNIGRCLESVKNIADEIVVVDSFSSDKTAEIAAQYQAKFIQHAFEGHIQQKNFAAQQASFNWVLSLDADEALSYPLQLNLLKVKQKHSHPTAYKMKRLTNYCGVWIKHCGWYPDIKLRLFDRTKGAWGGSNPHDKWLPDNADEKVELLNGDILHYSYYTVEEHIAQAEKYSTIAATTAFTQGKKSGRLTIFTKTFAKFVRNYFVKLGFLDGVAGFLICKIAAGETRKKYQKLLALNKNQG